MVSLVILTLNAAFTRWNFERGFLEYVASHEAGTMSGAAAELATLYQSDGNWEAFRRNPRRWNDFLRDGILDENERWRLEELREELGLDSDEALQLLDSLLHQARQHTPDSCPHCGERLI